MNWLCWHVGTSTDPKLAVVAKRAGNVPRSLVVAVWAYLLERASQAAERGHIGTVDAEAAAAALDCEPEQVTAIMAAMTAKDMLADGRVTNWNKRQHGNSTQRVKAFRERQKHGGNGETLHGVSGTGGTSQSVSETAETARERSATPETASNAHDRTGQDKEEPKTVPSPETGGPQRASAPPTGEAQGRPKAAKEPRGQFVLPRDWLPDEFAIAYAINLGLTHEQIRITGTDFVAYWTEGMGKGTRRSAKGWKTAWFNRCRVIAERGQRAPQGGNRGNRPDPATQERQDSAAVLRGMGYRVDGEPEPADLGAAGGPDTSSDPGHHRGPGAGEPRANGRGDTQAGVVVPDVRHLDGEHRADLHAEPRGGSTSPAAGPAQQGIREHQDHPQVVSAAAIPTGDRRDGERGVSAPGEDQGGPVQGQPGTGGGHPTTNTAGAPGAARPGGSSPSPVAVEPQRVIEEEDLLDIPAFFKGAPERQAAEQRAQATAEREVA